MTTRRDALRAGFTGLLGGWLGLKAMPAEARPANKVLPSISERDEDWAGVKIHVIEMTLPFNEPTLLFLVGHRRYLVPRFNEEEARFGIERNRPVESEVLVRSDADLQQVLLDRVRRVHEIRRPLEPSTPVITTCLKAHCPKGTDYGVLVSPEPLTIANLQLTVPATILFG